MILCVRSGMLPDFLIDQIRKRENDRRQEQPSIQLPLPDARRTPTRARQDEDERGVWILDLGS